MKKNSNNKIRLGVFVTLGIALFIVGIYFIGNRQHLFSSTFRISGIFKDVNGLQVGNNVRFAGINVGTIENIEIVSDTTVRVDMIIDVGTQKFIKKDAKAIIGSEGLMGNKVMVISPGTSAKEMIKDSDTIQTSIPVNMDDILANLKTTTDNASLITGDLATIMSGIRSGKGTIGKLFMDSSFAMNVDQTMVNLKKSSKGLDENMEAAKHNILFKGYFNKKEKEAQKAKEDAEAKKVNKKKSGNKSNTNDSVEKKGFLKGVFNKKDKKEEQK
ncbi:MAG: MlaD family protein [Bacteroidota bacterium]